MNYGMNLLLWTDHMHEGMLPVLERLKTLGYDGVEVPIFAPDEKAAAEWGRRLKDLGLRVTAVTIRTEPDNPISPDAKVRAAGVALTCRTLNCCQALGAETLCGPYHSAIGLFSGAGPTPDEWRWGVDSMRQVAEHAGQVGVTLAVESLNRFETYLLTCTADAAHFVADVNHPACKMMYDTFHANIEEKDVGQAIRGCAKYLGHVHISENDRGTPGRGAVRWQETFDAIREIGYDGWLTVEAFGLALPGIAAATKIWRRMFDSEDQLAREALEFMKRNVQSRG
jgi:D-psicose/D-tagatose/L-ribulose 3-epimerase